MVVRDRNIEHAIGSCLQLILLNVGPRPVSLQPSIFIILRLTSWTLIIVILPLVNKSFVVEAGRRTANSCRRTRSHMFSQ